MDFRVREDRQRSRGRLVLDAERNEYFRLVDLGLGNREASRLTGINERTGRRWRNGRAASGGKKATPPVRPVASPPVTLDTRGRFLDVSERLTIADLLREGASVRQIARELDRAPSTISREILRNRHPVGGQYRPYHLSGPVPARTRRSAA